MRGRKRRNDIPTDEFENVVSLYKNKISLRQIAFDYDVTTYVVRDVLVGMGVEIGPRGRPWKDKNVDAYSEDVQNSIDIMSMVQENKSLLNLAHFRRPLGGILDNPDVKSIRPQSQLSGQGFMDTSDNGEK